MRLILWTALAVAAAYTAVHTAPLAVSQEHRHPPQDAETHERFYKDWMRPDMPTVSCCNQQDCYPVEARMMGGDWYVKQRESGQWLRVPPEKIEHNRDNPDGRNHACISPYGNVFCFIVGTGG